MFRITDIGTDISAHLSMIPAVNAFSLFTAYQFLSSDRRFDASESKMRPSPSCLYRRLAPWWWRWSRRGFSLFTAYQILSAEFIENSTWQSCDCKLQYNTCGKRTRQFSGAADFSDHIVIISFQEIDHIWRLVYFLSALFVFLSVLFHFFSDGRVVFSALY